MKKPDPDKDSDDSGQGSRREKRQRQRAAARRQKALAATERKRREEAEKAKRREPKQTEEAEKPAAAKPPAEKPKSRRRQKPSAEKPKAEKPKVQKPVAGKTKGDEPRRERGAGRRGFGAAAAGKRLRGGAGKVGGGAQKVGTGALAVVAEVLKLGREMLVIPLQVWLAIAEVVGGFVLAAWLRAVLPALRLVWRMLGALLRFGERHITPARVLTVVALVAIGALVAAQWRDYSAVSVGTDAYFGDVGAVAPPPEVSSAPAHDAHGWVMLLIALLGIVMIAGAVLRRGRLAIWLVPIGIAVLVISVAIDAPKGLDEGDAAVAYESASASLLSGFWLQIAAGAVLVACGVMLPRALRPAPQPAGAPGPSLIDQLVARTRKSLERRRARPKRTRKVPRRLRRPAAKGKVQRAGM